MSTRRHPPQHANSVHASTEVLVPGSWSPFPVRWRPIPTTFRGGPVPIPGDPTAPDAPIRARVRDAIERAWLSAVAAGRLPAIEAGAAAPAVEVERPANAEFGDLATNLAMKLARPLRRPPLEIAEALAAALGTAAGAAP